MKNSPEKLEICLDERFPKTLPLFRNLILFENQNADHRARRLHDHLFQNVKDHCRLEAFCWNVTDRDDLGDLVESITLADIIIIAGCATLELPGEIEKALKIGLASRRVIRGALVALLGRRDTRTQDPSALHLHLQTMAQETGLNFFPGSFEIPQDDFASIHARACRTTPTMNRILHRNVRPIEHGSTNKN